MKLNQTVSKIKEKYADAREKGESTGEFIRCDLGERLLRRLFTTQLSHCAAGRRTKVFHHLFIHSLVLQEEKAFRPDSDAVHDFESWFITKKEFISLLNSLYQRNYVLVRMKDLLGGRVRLQPHQTPLVLSFDDMNYYEYMKGWGFAEKLDLTREEDSVTVLEHFIREHPDFSYQGARGIIALTGYEGALGYRDTEAPELKSLVAELKKRGFEFACHSWGHHHRIYSDRDPDGKKGIEDMEKWFAGVGKAVGRTDIFITPFGKDIRNNPLLHAYLKRKGFRYFCSVGNRHRAEKCGGCYYMERFNIDGGTLRQENYAYQLYYGNPQTYYSEARTRAYEPLKQDAATLVKHARFCLTIPTVYFWDGMGEILTRRLLWDKRKMYPDYYTFSRCLKLLRKMDGDCRAFDCGGLMKNFMMGGLYGFHYEPGLDMNSAGLLAHAVKAGDILTLPELPGVCLYMPGHVGIYVGEGQVIESTPNPLFGNGVCTTRLTDRPWEKWFYCPGVDYGEEASHEESEKTV